MLTFSEALTQLKLGHDMRRAAWPRIEFVRATPLQKLQRIAVAPNLQTTVAPYTATDQDLFATDWRPA